MRAAAELDGLSAHVDDADNIAVLFAEERDRAELLCLCDRHFLRLNVHTVENQLTDKAADFHQLLRRHGREVRKVVAQAVRLNERARLMGVVAQHDAQRVIKEVRRRVRAHDGLAAVGIDGSRHRVTDRERAGDELAVVHELAALVLLNIRHGKLRVARENHALIGDLAAHLRVERGLIENENRVLTGGNRVAQLVFGDDGDDLAVRFHVRVADKLGGRNFLAEFHAGPAKVAECFSGLSCAHLLLLHELLEGRLVNAQSDFLDHLACQVDREAVGIIEFERVRAGENRLLLLLVAFQHLREDFHAAVDRLGEVLFLRADHARDIGLLLPELGVLALIFMDNGVDDLIEERLVHAEELSVPGGSSEKTAQDIAAAFVRRQDTVADHEG